MTVRGVDHIGVTVPDIESATAFFGQALGAKVLYDTLSAAEGPKTGREMTRHLGVPEGTQQVAIRMLRLPDGPGLELFEFSGPRQHPAVLPCDLGWQHLAFYVDDLDEAMEKVRRAGGVVQGQPQPLPGPESGSRNRFVYCRTPWNSTLELLSYPDPQPYEQHSPARRWRPTPHNS